MGAWGYGLLQNDDSQDGLLHFFDSIEEDVLALRTLPPTTDRAARLAAGVGLLLQFQIWSCFDATYSFLPNLEELLDASQAPILTLPKPVIDLLRGIREGAGAELVYREGPLPPELAEAFFANEPGFSMERGTGVREECLFEHPAAIAYVQEVADRAVALVEEGFVNDDIGDAAREAGETIAAFTILLQLEPCKIDPGLFPQWWDLYVEAAAGNEIGEEGEFFAAYNRGMRQALEFGWRRFAGDVTLTLPEARFDLPREADEDFFDDEEEEQDDDSSARKS
jgi:hypothetical protein